jgi:hypothetical protein
VDVRTDSATDVDGDGNRLPPYLQGSKLSGWQSWHSAALGSTSTLSVVTQLLRLNVTLRLTSLAGRPVSQTDQPRGSSRKA